MTANSQLQTPWEETNEEFEHRRLSQGKEPGWTGTIAGIVLAVAAGALLLLMH